MNAKELGTTFPRTSFVSRHLHIERCDYPYIVSALNEITETNGVRDAYYEKEKKRLHFIYDPGQINIDTIEKILAKHKVEISHDWWTKFKEDHYRLADKKIQRNNKNYQ